MTDQLTRVRERTPHRYEAMYRDPDSVAAGVDQVTQAIVAAYYEANAGADEGMGAAIEEELEPIRSALANPTLVAAYVSVVPCVETFVSTELDTASPGKRGLGRSLDDNPRLGGAFCDQLASVEARTDFGLLIERMVFETYCGAAAALQSYYEPPTLPRVRPAAEVFELWVPAMYVGTSNLGELAIGLITAANGRTEKAVIAAGERHGLVAGIRRVKRERELVSSAAFWVAAGAALYWVPAQR